MNTARDMDLIRRMLGEDRISFLGYSYGTFLGPLYGEMFPDHLDRSVLDSATDPKATWREQEEAGVAATEDNVAAWQEWVAARDVTFGLGDEPADVNAVLGRFAAYLADQPLGDIPDVATFDTAIGTAIRYRSMWANLAWELGDLLPALDGAPVDSESARQLAVVVAPGDGGGESVAPDQDEPPTTDGGGEGGDQADERPNGTYQAILCDWEWPRDPHDYYPGMEEVAEAVPYGDSVSRVAPSNCTFTADRDPMVEIGEREYPEGVVVAAIGDTQTAYAGGVALADHLNMPLITVENSGIHGHYGEGDTCVDDAVNAYLVEGTLPDRRTACETTRDVVADIPTDDSGEGPAPKNDLDPSLEQISQRIGGTT